MIKTQHIRELGTGLWYVPSVFDQKLFDNLKSHYRLTSTEWELAYPHRLSTKFNSKQYPLFEETAHSICQQLIDITGVSVKPMNQEVFIDLPNHKLAWHFDNNNYKILLQVYMGDQHIPTAGTQWYLGERNEELWQQYGADSIVDVSGLPIVETPYTCNAGYINDNTQKKAHGTNRVVSGSIRESLLFTFG